MKPRPCNFIYVWSFSHTNSHKSWLKNITVKLVSGVWNAFMNTRHTHFSKPTFSLVYPNNRSIQLSQSESDQPRIKKLHFQINKMIKKYRCEIWFVFFQSFDKTSRVTRALTLRLHHHLIVRCFGHAVTFITAVTTFRSDFFKDGNHAWVRMLIVCAKLAGHRIFYQNALTHTLSFAIWISICLFW